MTKINQRADLSSSEDEACINILREAIDQQFLNNDLYSMEKAQIIPSSEAQINKLAKNSLRINSEQKNKFMDFGVTATLQSFIAKKLEEILERTIELESNEITNCCDEQKQRRSKNSGIKLLSTSKKFLTLDKIRKNCTELKKRSKRNKQIAEDDKDTLSKFHEAAINPEHILSKLDTKAWVNKHPEPEFKYKKLKNGILIEM